MTRLGIVNIVLFIFSALPAHARYVDNGGLIGGYVERIVGSSGEMHRIQGDCVSACTMWLGHKPVCVYPDTVLWFHGAVDSSGHISKIGNIALMAFYPKALKAYLISHHWLQSAQLHSISGLGMLRFGIPLCRGVSQ